jgi:hypothetical protein
VEGDAPERSQQERCGRLHTTESFEYHRLMDGDVWMVSTRSIEVKGTALESSSKDLVQVDSTILGREAD